MKGISRPEAFSRLWSLGANRDLVAVVIVADEGIRPVNSSSMPESHM
jgi:hypothetical protein